MPSSKLHKIVQDGFTMMELLIVIAIIGIIAAMVLIAINPAKMLENANYASAKVALEQIGQAAQHYAVVNGGYPPDANRNIPAEILQYVQSTGSDWPKGPFHDPGGDSNEDSVFDWDNWEGESCHNGDPGSVQISLRQIKKFRGLTFDKNGFAMYYVVHGRGIPHCSNSATHGICINCESWYPPAGLDLGDI